MAVTIDELEIKIQADSSKAAGGINALVASLTRLKSVVDCGLGLSATAKQLRELSNATSNSKFAAFVNTIQKAQAPLQGFKGMIAQTSDGLKQFNSAASNATTAKIPFEQMVEQLDDLNEKIRIRTELAEQLRAEWEYTASRYGGDSLKALKLEAGLNNAQNQIKAMIKQSDALGFKLHDMKNGFNSVGVAAQKLPPKIKETSEATKRWVLWGGFIRH